MCKGKFVDNLFNDPIGEMAFKVKLTFQYLNVFGALIYKDTLGWHVFKLMEHKTPFMKCPMVNYQGGSYIGQDGAHYEVTNYPFQMNSFGILQANKPPSEEPYYGLETQVAMTSIPINE